MIAINAFAMFAEKFLSACCVHWDQKLLLLLLLLLSQWQQVSASPRRQHASQQGRQMTALMDKVSVTYDINRRLRPAPGESEKTH